MKTFQVSVPFLQWEAYEVDAETREEAVQKVLAGQADHIFSYDGEILSEIPPEQCVIDEERECGE